MFYVKNLVFGFVAANTRKRDGTLKIQYTSHLKMAMQYKTFTGARRFARLLGCGHIVLSHEEAAHEEGKGNAEAY